VQRCVVAVYVVGRYSVKDFVRPGVAVLASDIVSAVFAQDFHGYGNAWFYLCARIRASMSALRCNRFLRRGRMIAGADRETMICYQPLCDRSVFYLVPRERALSLLWIGVDVSGAADTCIMWWVHDPVVSAARLGASCDILPARRVIVCARTDRLWSPYLFCSESLSACGDLCWLARAAYKSRPVPSRWPVDVVGVDADGPLLG